MSPPAHPSPQDQRDWPAYYDAVAGKPPRDTLLLALQRFDEEQRTGHAVDLGCGDGRDTVELLARGWSVTAIDAHPQAFIRLRKRPIPHPQHLRTLQADFQDAPIPPCDLCNASFSLPFCHPDHFLPLWQRITRAIRPSGRFAGQFFGPRDSWASIPSRTHIPRAQLDHLFQTFIIEHLAEDEKDGFDATGNPKHWHVFHVVARKLPNT